MNHSDADKNADQEHNALDQRIRAALHVEPSPQQVDRLTDFWRQQSRSEIRRRHIRQVAAVVASMATMVAVAVSVRLCWEEPDQQPLEPNQTTAAAPEVSDPIPDDVPERGVVENSPIEERSLSAGRPPTTYERFMFAAHTRRPVARQRPSVVAMVDEAIEQLCRDPACDVEQLAESFGPMGDNAGRLLSRRLLRSKDDRKHAILRLLVACGTRESIPPLLRLCRREVFRDEALGTLEQIVGVERFAHIVGQATDRRVRAAILSRMLAADSMPVLRSFLVLIHDEAIRDEALAAAAADAGPLLEELLILLDDEDESVRISAALVLGHMNGPEVTNSLIARVTRKTPPPKEAWIALLACRGMQAEEFLAYAASQPKLLGQVNLARTWWARITL